MPQRTTSSARNVMSNWASQAVLTVSGFILPRLINDSMGPAALGVWDFAWSMRVLISMSHLGMGSSAGYHVSRFRATEDWRELNETLSATQVLVYYTAALAAGITAVVWYLTPSLMRGEQENLIHSARWMVVFMGVATIMQLITAVYGGILVGNHRFDLLNSVEMSADIALVAIIFAAVLMKAPLSVLGLLVALRHVVDTLAKRVLAHRVYPELRLYPQWTDWPRFKQIVGYGSKTLADSIGMMLLQQGPVVVVLAYHDAATVAMFARPLALIRSTTRFVMGFARILVPKAGEAYERGERERLAELLVKGTQYTLYLALPAVLLFVVMGSPILHVWMGPEYADATALVILALGFLPYFAQRSTWHILLGLGAHGLPSLASLMASFVCIGLSLLFVGRLGWGVCGAALAMAIPVGLVNLFVLPYAGCRAVGVPLRRYALHGLLYPLPAIVPVVLVLLPVRLLLPDRPTVSLLIGLCLAAPIVVAIYWRHVLPDRMKQTIRGRWQRSEPQAGPEEKCRIQGTTSAPTNMQAGE